MKTSLRTNLPPLSLPFLPLVGNLPGCQAVPLPSVAKRPEEWVQTSNERMPKDRGVEATRCHTILV